MLLLFPTTSGKICNTKKHPICIQRALIIFIVPEGLPVCRYKFSNLTSHHPHPKASAFFFLYQININYNILMEKKDVVFGAGCSDPICYYAGHAAPLRFFSRSVFDKPRLCALTLISNDFYGFLQKKENAGMAGMDAGLYF